MTGPTDPRSRLERNNRLGNQVSTLSYLRIAVPLLLIGVVVAIVGLVSGMHLRAAGGALLALSGVVVLLGSRSHNATVLRDGVPAWGRELAVFLVAVALAAAGVLCLR